MAPTAQSFTTRISQLDVDEQGPKRTLALQRHSCHRGADARAYCVRFRFPRSSPAALATCAPALVVVREGFPAAAATPRAYRVLQLAIGHTPRQRLGNRSTLALSEPNHMGERSGAAFAIQTGGTPFQAITCCGAISIDPVLLAESLAIKAIWPA
jgi:hypothetical protein